MSLPSKAFFFLFPLLFIWTVDSAAHAPSPSVVDCSTLILKMADCLTFVSNGSTLTKPQEKCCSGFKTVLQTDADCLCQAFKNNVGLGVNLTKAMELPSACKLSAPSIASCGLSISPSGAPVAAPGSSIAAPPTSTQGINEQAPAPAPEKAGSSILTVSLGYAAGMAALGVASIFF